jgi:mannosyltransferase
MEPSSSCSEVQIEEQQKKQPQTEGLQSILSRVSNAICALTIAVSISIWFIAIRTPLRLDEMGSFWVIKEGFSRILSRQGGLSFPAYSYILWLSTKIIGTSEIALRAPSVLAMLGAVYLLYRIARELFEPDIAVIASAIFCLHPVIIFASIDARPYAFAALMTNAAILILLRLRHNNSNWMAALFGL